MKMFNDKFSTYCPDSDLIDCDRWRGELHFITLLLSIELLRNANVNFSGKSLEKPQTLSYPSLNRLDGRSTIQ